MLSCIKDGNVPWFYYNDLLGVGYGTAFFYGQLTLYPFLILVPFGIEAFTAGYLIVSWIVLFFGASFFFSRFHKDYVFLATCYVCSPFMLVQGYSYAYQVLLPLGLSLFFLAFCIDFFRDKKSFLKASVMYFVLLNTHMMSSLFAFLICCVFLLFYFDSKRVLEYAKFAGCTCLLCAYTLVNFIWHSGVLTRINDIARTISFAADGVAPSYGAVFPLGDVLSDSFLGETQGYRVLDFITFFVLCYAFRKARKDYKTLFIGVYCILLVFIGIRPVWLIVEQFLPLAIQFPVRYMYYVLIGLFLISFRGVNISRWMKVAMILAILPQLLFGSMVFSFGKEDYDVSSDYEKVTGTIVMGEYLDKSFVFDIDQFMQLSSQTGFTVNKDEISYEASGEETVRFPKLYYRGYKAWTEDGTELPVEMGYSQFINVKTPPGYRGKITLKYCHPIWLQALGVFCYSMFIIMLLSGALKNIKKSDKGALKFIQTT